MKCLSPLNILVKDKYRGNSYKELPCGKCVACLKNYQNSVMLKLHFEIFNNPNNCVFFTLTYRETQDVKDSRKSCTVPLKYDVETGEAFRTVYKKHVQDWLKRFRIAYKRMYDSDPEIKYYITSEYGPRTLRPHYHGILVTPLVNDLKLLFDDWEARYGYTSYKTICSGDENKASRYVAKYCSKGQFENPLVLASKVDPTFHLCSHFFDQSYIDKHRGYFLCLDVPEFKPYYRRIVSNTRLSPASGYKLPPEVISRIVDRSFLVVDNYRYQMPRYFKQKIYYDKDYFKDSKDTSSFLLHQMQDEIQHRSEDFREQQFRAYSMQFNGFTDSQILRFWCDSQNNDQVFLDTVTKQSLARFYDKSRI